MSSNIKVRLTEEEHALACEAAALAGLDLAPFVRAAVLGRTARMSPRMARRRLVAEKIARWTAAVQTIARDLAIVAARDPIALADAAAITALRDEVRALHRAVLSREDDA